MHKIVLSQPYAYHHEYVINHISYKSFSVLKHEKERFFILSTRKIIMTTRLLGETISFLYHPGKYFLVALISLFNLTANTLRILE